MASGRLLDHQVFAVYQRWVALDIGVWFSIASTGLSIFPLSG